LTGALTISSSVCDGEIHFDQGQIIGAKSGSDSGMKALSHIAGAIDGTFEFEKSGKDYEHTIQASSNTALILDMLRAKDEEDHGMGALDAF
jgi:hypothetical protein